MRRHFDIIRRTTVGTPLKHLANKIDPKQEGRFWRAFRKVYFIIWGIFVLADLLFATADLLHFTPFNLIYSQPTIISNQDLDNNGKVAGVQIPTSSPEVKKSLSPTPKVSTINKSDISIRVLNGSRISGVASDAKEILEKRGFVVSSVGTTKYFYANTTIYYKDSLKKAEEVQKNLSGYNAVLKQSSITENYDILVVIGKK